MATQATIGLGTVYEIFDAEGSPNDYIVLGEVTNIDLGSDESDLIDATHSASPNSRREYVGGLIDGGEASVDLNFVPGSATHALLRARQEARTASSHRITFPDGDVVTFDAIVRSISRTVAMDDKMTMSFTAKKTGAEVWT